MIAGTVSLGYLVKTTLCTVTLAYHYSPVMITYLVLTMQTQTCPARLTMSAFLPLDSMSGECLFSVLMELFSTKTAQSVTGGE